MFSSARERRLWLWTLVVVATIYSTLGLARNLAGELRDREMFDAFFIVGFLLILVAVALVALRARPGGREIGVGVAIIAVYLMVLARLGIPEERTHLFEYSVVAVLVHEALKERAANGRQVRAPAMIAIMTTAAIGWLDEGIQAVLPSRVYDIRDVGFNALAGLLAVTGSVALAYARTKASRRSYER